MSTKPIYYDDIDTLAALRQTRMHISVQSNEFRNLFGGIESGSRSLQALKNLENSRSNAIVSAALHHNICSVERFSEIPIQIEVLLRNFENTTTHFN